MNILETNASDQEMIRESAIDFAKREIEPLKMKWDEAQEFPIEVFKKMGHMGFMGVLVPEIYGGSGLGYQEYITIIDEISQVCGGIGLSLAAHNSLCTNHILSFGNEEQKHLYLPKLASGEWIGAWGLTETGSGSDAGGMQTTARKEGEYYIINGSKNFITHAISGDITVLMARTGDEGDSHSMSAFIIEKGTPGFSSGKKEDKLGMRASETAGLFLDNCRVHESQRIGEEGQGFIQALKLLEGGRISIGALALGIAKGALKSALAYTQERKQFKKPIAKFQAVRFDLADMATEIEASELLIRNAAKLKMKGKSTAKQSAMAKLYASETAVKVSTKALQLFGGYGYSKEYPVEKYYRDAMLCTIGEGTSNIQKMVIAKELLK
ncbi:acyl-CoA dehydrogenase family protein [Jiulongibacter sediminis]|jgi:alkylation response protein AidB-like acyl-CoA dehydrogenase|uniref:acyl-CoA dehydrogenase family protein n=1 Tax=Jiulongibacter sediminis TaxID=1605367 RepID=UPI0026EB3B02|nr:acyl-CoA dehydrogenase family protein [Jiulongibacter sediminis]